jgi:hypothetical protein
VRHRTAVIFGGWLAFFLTFATTAVVWPLPGLLVPLASAVVAAVLVTPALHVQLYAFGITDPDATD